MTDVVLRLSDLTKTYVDGEEETKVLKGIDLTFRRGEFVALMGPSGSGKSTLLAILGTLLKPTSGEVELVGNRLSTLDEQSVTRFRNLHIGFVFQFHHLLPDFTALENVLFPSYPRRSHTPDADRARAVELLRRVGLADRMHFRATKLSGGQKQRVAIARALMNAPDIVLADEPTGNLDRDTGEQVLVLMRELCAELGTLFLISTHDEAIAAESDRVVRILDGRVVSDEPVAITPRPHEST
ncbi:MAG: ABC transporter ATP-binding protein [Gemmatimonadaceae bacterium]|nr:ABC transporter ATP-binding protein [Gemmatimonadaceae bacterium]